MRYYILRLKTNVLLLNKKPIDITVMMFYRNEEENGNQTSKVEVISLQFAS